MIEDLRGRNHFAKARTLCTGHRSMQTGRERRGDQHLPTPAEAGMRKGSPRIPDLRVSEFSSLKASGCDVRVVSGLLNARDVLDGAAGAGNGDQVTKTLFQ